MGGHSGDQLVQSGTHFVPKEKLRATRIVEKYILKSAVFGKPPEKGYFIFYILSVRVIKKKRRIGLVLLNAGSGHTIVTLVELGCLVRYQGCK